MWLLGFPHVTSNQLVAFITGTVLCFIFYYGFEAISTLFTDGVLQQQIAGIGALQHFNTVGKGVMRLSDSVYFLGSTILFILGTKWLINTSES